MDPNPQNEIPNVPPPPPEVKVRTMRSDIDAMAKSGGGLPHFESVPVTGVPAETMAAESAIPAAATPSAPAASPQASAANTAPAGAPHRTSIGGVIAVIIVAIVAVGAVAYFAYKELGTTQTPSAQTSSQ